MQSSKRAVIVGGGIAGPTIALFLARHGITPIVCEAYPKTDDVGGAFQIAPNGLRVLRELGLADAVLSAGHACHDMVFKNHLGRTIGTIHTRRSGTAANVSRPAIHRVLRDACAAHGVEIRYEKRLRDVSLAGDEVVATFEDGSTEVADFLVGADGVHSRVRAWMHPGPSRARDTEMLSIGGFCGPDVAPPDAADADRLTFIAGPRHQLGYARMGAGTWGWWCHVHGESEADRRALRAMSDEDLRGRMLERYRGWCAPAEAFIAGTTSWLRTPIHDVPSLPSWQRGRVVLMGDAAHAMSPAGGQGASMALEDAMLLGSLVASRPPEDAFARFERLRKAHAERVVAQAYVNDRRSLQEHGPIGQWLRDRVTMPLFAGFIERALNDVYTAPIPT